jgi:hypothetical protein
VISQLTDLTRICDGQVLGTRYINELPSLVDTTPDESAWLASERDRLQTEIDRLVASIAAGVPPDTIAPKIWTPRVSGVRLQRA